MANSARTCRVFLIDDHPVVRQGLERVLSQAGFEICGEAGGSDEALGHRHLPRADLVLVDLSLGDENGLEVIAVLAERGLRVLTLSVHEDPIHIQRAMAAGASAYVTKRETTQYLLDAVAAVLVGRTYVSPRAGASLAKLATGPNEFSGQGLSRQQREVYDLLGQGFSLHDIARQLDLSVRTVESYCARMIEKFRVHGMQELRRRAIADRTAPAE